ncbi:TetR/AcrR family transcriptional regulator [Sphingomonas faeni]|jgi:AcrR family transcriptional regulator|uniref:TetR/AcrR family transcriptional regulator n=1 Tax=Sphingomonas faeni TaxID=185950 RepID=UPI003364DA6B
MEKRVRISRAERHAQTREQLLDAARSVFAKHGYGGASIDRIAAEAGYSKGAIYSNFESKEAIMLALLERYADDEIAEFNRIMQLDPTTLKTQLKDRLDTLNADLDWDVMTMELQLHARRNPAFAERFFAHEARLTEFHAGILAERFAREKKTPPIDPLTMSLALRTIACSLNLKVPPAQRVGNEAGRIVHQLLDLMIERATPSTGDRS